MHISFHNLIELSNHMTYRTTTTKLSQIAPLLYFGLLEVLLGRLFGGAEMRCNPCVMSVLFHRYCVVRHWMKRCSIDSLLYLRITHQLGLKHTILIIFLIKFEDKTSLCSKVHKKIFTFFEILDFHKCM